MAFPRGNAPAAAPIRRSITDYERSIQAPTLVFGVTISIRAISTWKRPGGSAANPQDAVGSIVHSFATNDPAFPRGNEPGNPRHAIGAV